MGRPSNFTDAEDRIILRYAGEPAAVTNAALTDAGFPERSGRAISQRRYQLRQSPASSGVRLAVAQSEIGQLESERIQIETRLADLDKERRSLSERREVIGSALVAAAARIAAETGSESAPVSGSPTRRAS